MDEWRLNARLIAAFSWRECRCGRHTHTEWMVWLRFMVFLSVIACVKQSFFDYSVPPKTCVKCHYYYLNEFDYYQRALARTKPKLIRSKTVFPNCVFSPVIDHFADTLFHCRLSDGGVFCCLRHECLNSNLSNIFVRTVAERHFLQFIFIDFQHVDRDWWTTTWRPEMR